MPLSRYQNNPAEKCPLYVNLTAQARRRMSTSLEAGGSSRLRALSTPSKGKCLSLNRGTSWALLTDLPGGDSPVVHCPTSKEGKCMWLSDIDYRGNNCSWSRRGVSSVILHRKLLLSNTLKTLMCPLRKPTRGF